MTTDQLQISVVVPTHNRRERLRRLLDSLMRQTAGPESFEVVVVIDGSTDGTEEMLNGLETPFDLVVLTQQQRGVDAARNSGAHAARGAFLLFLDDDIRAHPNLVAEYLRVQHSEGGVVAMGRLSKLLPDRPRRWAVYRALDRDDLFDRLASGRPPTFLDCHGGNLCLPRGLYLSVGGYTTDCRVGGFDDTELGFRLHRHGARFVYVDNAAAAEDDRESLFAFLADAEKRGEWSLRLYELHPPMLRFLTLGGWGEASWKSRSLRRVLLWLRVPGIVLGFATWISPNKELGRKWLRFVVTYCYWQGLRKAPQGRAMFDSLRTGTTILAYHALGARSESKSRTVVPVQNFARQMRLLRLFHYNVISLSEFVDYLLANQLPPKRAAVLTFDDGYEDNVALGLPIAERWGWRLTIFPVIGTKHDTWNTDKETAARSLIDAEGIRNLKGRVDFGAHTQTHRQLNNIESTEAEREIVAGKKELEAVLGAPVRIFAYPYGAHSDRIRTLVRDAGFVAACTVDSGRNWPNVDPFALRRLSVRGTDSALRFAAMLWFGARHSR